MEVLLNLILIQFIVVNIVDISGIMDSIKNGLSKWLDIRINKPLPLIGCSYCSTWWAGLIYLIVTGNFTLYYIAALLFICSLTTVTSGLTYLIRDILTKIISIVNKLIL